MDWKDTLVVLIPKVEGADAPGKFRLISLCQTIYKIVAKILVVRLKGWLPRLISEEQGAFVPGRSISNHCLLAQEMVNKFRTSSSSAGLMALKIDMEQAYDRMSWSTLTRVMHEFGFPEIFQRWVLNCICNPRFSLLINGKCSDWIMAKCGFRQGCPLSPYLFILCSELMSLACRNAGSTIGVPIARGGPSVSHLLYADDILVFAEASMTAAKNIATILGNYCAWTGQRVNVMKSAVMFSKSTVNWKKNRIANFLGYRKVAEVDYLGIKLAMRKLCRNDFTGVLQKCKGKVHAWGNRVLSLAGRATLINSSLLSVPMYIMTHADVPSSVLADIERLCRSFLWGHGHNRKGLHYVSWEVLCLPGKCGGLGFHASKDWRGPLRARLSWDFLQHKDSILNRCIQAKYGRKVWDTDANRTDSVTWRIIKDGATSLKKIIKWNIGNGESVNVLDQNWIGDIPLNDWPTFADTAGLTGRTVQDLRTQNQSWNMTVLRNHFGQPLIDRIMAIQAHEAQEDAPVLLQARSGRTITALAFEKLFHNYSTKPPWIKPLQLHPRERFFWWRLGQNALPTNDWLCQHRLGVSNRCPWGCDEKEDASHIAASCENLHKVLLVLRKWGIFMPRFDNLDILVAVLSKASGPKLGLARIYCTAVYHNWRARNAKKHGKPYGTPTTIAATILENLPRAPLFPIQGQWDTTQPSRLLFPSTWCSPPPGWLKFNVDGARLPSNAAGIGVVVRDNNGLIQSAMGHCMEHWDSAHVEMVALLSIRKVLQPWMFDSKGIIIEGDCANILQVVQSCLQKDSWKDRPPDAPDISFLSCFKQILIKHVPREANKVAHFCASFALQHSLVWHFFENDATVLLPVLAEDMVHVVDP